MRILVTGGAGFIGSHLVSRLVRDGHHVDVIDNLSTGSIENLCAGAGTRNVSMHLDRVENAALVSACVANADLVFHLVPSSNEKNFRDDPGTFSHKVLLKLQGVLDECGVSKVPLVIAVAGHEEAGYPPVSSTLPLHDPMHLSHRLGRQSFQTGDAIYELAATAAAAKRRQQVAVARLTNVVGDRNHRGLSHDLYCAMIEMVTDGDVRRLGAPSRSWNMSFVEDVAGGLAACTASAAFPGGVVFFPGRPTTFTTAQLTAAIAQVLRLGVPGEVLDQRLLAFLAHMRDRVVQELRVSEPLDRAS